ncbi:MAG TPA: efflux RND transporter periplasmic adaptor subunit [Myxococcota bacterium]|nr:efflux RND transporter periplasmic adaptor subunit [Myxococcota bacterium]
MRRHQTLAFAALLLCAAPLACAREDHAGDQHTEESFEEGPHGGRMLADGDFALEMVLVEAGGPPELRAYAFEGEKPIEPSRVSLQAILHRLGGRTERIAFEPRGDHLAGVPAVEEPHSFDVEVLAREGGNEHRFDYASYENRVTLDADQLEVAGIELETAAPATIRERVVLNGRIAPNEDALAHVMPRFPGLVRSVHKRLGDPVAPGELLAVIESNESLHPYELRSRTGGRVIAKDVSPGENASPERELFAIADLSTVWADLDVYRRDFGRLRVAQPVRVDAGDGSPPVETQLAYLSPIGSVNTQTLLARAVLPNPDGSWRPGLFVTAEVEVGASEVPVAIAPDAIQRLDGVDVVFVSDGTTFEAQPVELGRRDDTHVEIVSGLSAGQRYVGAGSFVIKAEIGKSGAGHDH